MPVGTVNAADGFAMAMVVILTISFGVVALLLFGIYRSGQRRASEVEELLEELRREDEGEKQPAPTGSGEERQPWEKDDDWWK